MQIAPVTIINSFVEFGLILIFPTFFLQEYGHLILVAVQIVGFTYLLQRTIRHFKSHRDLIVSKAVQELGLEQTTK